MRLKSKQPLAWKVILFLLLLTLGNALGASAQSNLITMRLKNAALIDVFNQIERQTTYRFSYFDAEIDAQRNITLSVKKAKVSAVLDRCLKNRNLTYRIVSDKSIVILKKTPKSTTQDKADKASRPTGATRKVTGVITDEHGEPVVGASVLIKGTGKGIVSDLDGRFTLDVPAGATLRVTYVGFSDKEVRVGDRSRMDIVMQEDSHVLDEVVAVGYATQKKVDMTGAVSSVNIGELTESRPFTNVTQALVGQVPGLNVVSSSFQPGNDNLSFTVRGQGTLNNSNPLVIIDGVESAFNTVNPQDIESVSVLKDASSAAIYGSRAANGVILITTKKGKTGRVKVDYNGYVSFESVRKNFEPVSNYADYMELVNEGYTNGGMAAPFSQTTIDTWRNATDHWLYPNTNWMDALFKTGAMQNHIVSMSGGTDKLRFYSSLGYNDNPGVLDNSGLKKYTMRMNVEADIRPWITLGLNLNGYLSDMQPGYNYMAQMFTLCGASTPGMVYRDQQGRFTMGSNPEEATTANTNNPVRMLYAFSGKNRITNLRPRFVATLRPFKGFSLTGSFNYEMIDQKVTKKPEYPELIDLWTGLDNSVAGQYYVTNTSQKTDRYFNDLVARYNNKVFDKLDIGVMAGASNELYRTDAFSATKYDLIDPSLDVISAATGEASASGNRSEWSMRSFFGRINLNWDEKYLLEANLRADGSSRFAKGRRWGYFPSISAGWRISQEKFMQGILNGQLSNLKLRASYGSLGNNAVGNYDYQSLYTTNGVGNNYSLADQMVVGLARNAIANPKMTWETTHVLNFGVDFGLFNNRLNGTIDYFNKRTSNILINLPAPAVHGSASIPKTNSAVVTNNGIETTLSWRDRIGDFSYGISGNFSYVKNRVTKYKGKDKAGMSINAAKVIWEGHSINALYTMVVDRIVQTDDDLAKVQEMIDNAPLDENGNKKDPFAATGTPAMGDILYKDVNGDGIIDYNDKEIKGDNQCPYLAGLTFDATWKGFDFSLFAQGQFGGKTFWLTKGFNMPVVELGFQLSKRVVDGRWYEGRTDATYPRLLPSNYQRNIQICDLYLENKSFVKIRNIQLGYTIPHYLTNKIGLDRVRVYGSLENFFTFTNYHGIDPEASGSVTYPSMRQVVMGINLSF